MDTDNIFPRYTLEPTAVYVRAVCVCVYVCVAVLCNVVVKVGQPGGRRHVQARADISERPTLH